MYSDYASLWKKFYKLNNYYHQDLEKLACHLVPPVSSIIEFSSRGGELLSMLPNKNKVGVEEDEGLVTLAKKRYKKIKFLNFKEYYRKLKDNKFDYILLSHTLLYREDIQLFVRTLKKISSDNTRIIVTSFNFLWKPLLNLTERLGLRLPQLKEPNWLTPKDIENIFYLEGFEKIKTENRFLFPFNIPFLSDFINRTIAKFPIINSICLTNYTIFRPIPQNKKLYSVSIVIPARNEKGNMKGILYKINKLGKKTEVIFIEGHSTDGTYQAIEGEIKKYKGPIKVKLYKQRGKGKGDAVRLGFEKAENDVLIILDADLTVQPDELSKFYESISKNQGDLIIGSRLVYPMEQQAMRLLNYLGNKIFSWAFTFLLGQSIKDTLCGTKALLKENYEKIVDNRYYFGNFDPFGDYDLIFGASKLNLKILEIPVRYKDRTYGKTNISRFEHGFLLLNMVIFAAKKLKFY